MRFFFKPLFRPFGFIRIGKPYFYDFGGNKIGLAAAGRCLQLIEGIT